MQNGGNKKNRFRKLVSPATAIGTVSPYLPHPHPPHAQLSHLLTTQCRPQLQVNISQQLKANSRNHSRQQSFQSPSPGCDLRTISSMEDGEFSKFRLGKQRSELSGHHLKRHRQLVGCIQQKGSKYNLLTDLVGQFRQRSMRIMQLDRQQYEEMKRRGESENQQWNEEDQHQDEERHQRLIQTTQQSAAKLMMIYLRPSMRQVQRKSLTQSFKVLRQNQHQHQKDEGEEEREEGEGEGEEDVQYVEDAEDIEDQEDDNYLSREIMPVFPLSQAKRETRHPRSDLLNISKFLSSK